MRTGSGRQSINKGGGGGGGGGGWVKREKERLDLCNFYNKVNRSKGGWGGVGYMLE